jgi:Flp pilus assembly protein TadD
VVLLLTLTTLATPPTRVSARDGATMPTRALVSRVAWRETRVALHDGRAPQGNSAAAPDLVARLIERVRAAAPDDATFASAVEEGRRLIAAGRFREAAELFAALVERRPRDAAALYGAALAFFNSGRRAEAEPLARTAADEALSLLRRAEAARASGEVLSGARSFAADALVLLSVAEAVKGDDAGALKTAGRAVEVEPRHFDAQLTLGRARFGAGDPTGAAAAFRSAVALRPDDARARFFLATALERAGEIGAALEAYRELVRRRPEAAEGHLGLGVLLVKRGGDGVEEGINALNRAVATKPDSYEARVTLGRALLGRGRAAEAVAHLKRAAELAPGNPEPHFQLSLAYRRLGRKAEAEAETEAVRRIHEARRGVSSPAPQD